MSRIAVQITASFLALTALTVGVGAAATVLMTAFSGEVQRTLDENVRSVVAAERMSRALDAQEAARVARDSLGFASGAAAFQTALAHAEAAAVLPEEPALIDSIRTAQAAYAASWLDRDETQQKRAELLAFSDRLHALNERAARERAAAAGAAATSARRSLLLALLCALAASAVAGLYFTRKISRPIQALTERVGEVGQGHFGQRVAEGGGGEVGALAAAFNEMSERLEAYEALNLRALLREKRTAESLVAAIPSPVVVTAGPEARVHLVNAAATALLGKRGREGEALPGDGLVGRPLAEAAPALASIVQHARVHDPDPLLDVDADGATRTYRLRRTEVDVPADPEAGGGGSDRLAVWLLDDVTPFRALDVARRDFLAAVSHELRTPLTSMHVAADLLLRDAAGPLSADQRELAEIVRGDAQRMKGLTARLLDLARVETGARPHRPVDLRGVAEGAAAGVRLPAAERGIAVALEGQATVAGDADGLAMAVSNLAANAVRHATSRVTIRLASSPAGARLSVEDDGPGLPAGAEDRVFDPLVQLGNSGGSAGLGLAIVRRVAEAHGGRAWAEAGPGGRFYLSLPRREIPTPSEA